MYIDYTVHSVAEESIPAMVRMGDSDVRAAVAGLTVEMVTGDGPEHGHTFRFVPKDSDGMAHHKSLFQIGRKVRVSFDGV